MVNNQLINKYAKALYKLALNNNALNDGGAIFCDWDSKPTIENCTFTGNL